MPSKTLDSIKQGQGSSALQRSEELETQDNFAVDLLVGLRLGEVIRLRPQGIDFERELVQIRQGKHRKDLYAMLHPVAKGEFPTYVRHYQHGGRLFQE